MNRSNLKIFTAISFLKNAYFYLPVLTLFLLSNDVPLSAVVFSTAIYSIASFLGEIPTGMFADKVGQKTSLIVGYLFEAIGLFMLLLFPSTIGLYIACIVQGFAGSFLSGAEEALLFESCRLTKSDDYQKRYAAFLSNGQISFMISTVIAGFALSLWGIDAFGTLLTLTCIGLVISAILAMFLQEQRSLLPAGVRSSLLPSLLSDLKQSFLMIQKNDTISTLTIVTILTLSGEWFLLSVYPAYFQTHNVPLIWIGLTLSIGTFVNIIFSRYIYLLEKWLPIEKILLIINLTIGLAYLSMAIFVNPIFLIGIYILMNGIMNIEAPIISDYINSHTPSKIRATVLSGVSFIRRFFSNIIYIVLGVVVGLYGVQSSLIFQGLYLIIGVSISYYLLVKCGCVHRVANPKGEMWEFK